MRCKRAAGSLYKKPGPAACIRRKPDGGDFFRREHIMETATMTKLPAVLEQAVQVQKIELSKVNFMLPSQTFGEVIGKFDKVTLEVVQVDPNPKNGDVYEVADGKFALTKIPLKKISAAISIQWVPATTGSVECTDKISRAKATGVMRKPNGDLITITDEKTIDMDTIEEELRFKAEEKAEHGNPDKVKEWGKNEKTGKSYPKKLEPWTSEEEHDRWVERKVKIGSMEKRKFKNELAMSGALNRVIRSFVAIKNSYTAEEIAKPFVFPRVTIDTGKMLNDPKLRGAAIGLIAGSTTTVFGPDAGAVTEHRVHGREKVFDPAPGSAVDVVDAEVVEDPFAGISIEEPELTPEEKRRKTAIDALDDFHASDYLSEAQKQAVRSALDDNATPIEKLEELQKKCKGAEQQYRRGRA